MKKIYDLQKMKILILAGLTLLMQPALAENYVSGSPYG